MCEHASAQPSCHSPLDVPPALSCLRPKSSAIYEQIETVICHTESLTSARRVEIKSLYRAGGQESLKAAARFIFDSKALYQGTSV